MKKLLFACLLPAFLSHASSNLWTDVSTTVKLGYDSRYVLYGYDQGPNLYHADVLFWKPLSEKWSAWAGSWYGTQPDGTYNEIDLYTGADYQISQHLSAGVAYALFNYIELPYPAADRSHEFSGHLTFTAGSFSLALKDLYDTEGEGHLARTVASFKQPITSRMGISLSAEYGYSFDYYAVGNGPHHTLFKAELPWKINDTFCIAPFIAHSLALDVIDSFEKDRTYGGISLSAAF